MKTFSYSIALILVFSFDINAQNDSTGLKILSNLKVIGFIDAYYAYDFNNTERVDRGILNNGVSPYYSHTSHNQISINNMVVGVKYEDNRMRGSAILHAGTYVQKNYTAEPELLKHIYEAYAGVRFAKNLWLDAGIFTSHIGLESAISKDNMVLTRSLTAENTPYYLSGAKLTWEDNSKKWLLSALVLNGWQTIQSYQRPQKALGTQIQFKPIEKILINSSTYFGAAPVPMYNALAVANTLRGGDFLMRYFHNLYITYLVTDKLTLAASFDLGFQQKSITNKSSGIWYNPTFWMRYKVNNQFAIAGRAEHYNDQNGFVIATGSTNNFVVSGFSLGLDYSPIENIMLRIEGRTLNATDKVFFNQSTNQSTHNNTWVTASIAAWLK